MKTKSLLSLLAAFTMLVTFSDCNRQKTSDAELAEIRKQGDFIIDTTFKTLSGQLITAVKDSGVNYAIRFCNLNAYPLVETLSGEFDVAISRKTTMARNQDNVVNAMDRIQNTGYLMQLKQRKELSPNLVEHKNGFTYYKPIIVQPQCLACHGSKEIIGPVYETISSLYPADDAIGYKAGDLRGVWRVDFNSK